MGDGPVCCWLALLCYSLSPSFCGQAWQCLRLGLFAGKFSLSFFLFLSLVIPQFGLLSHISSFRLPSGHSVLVLTLSNVARASLFSPRLLVADASIWATSLRVAIRHVIYGGFFLFVFFLPVMLPSEIPKLPTDPLVGGFLMFGNFSSFMTPSPGQISIPNSFVSLFVFYIWSYLLSKTMSCLSGCLVSSARVQK